MFNYLQKKKMYSIDVYKHQFEISICMLAQLMISSFKVYINKSEYIIVVNKSIDYNYVLQYNGKMLRNQNLIELARRTQNLMN